MLGVPVVSKALSGQDSLLSIVQMPAGVPVGTLAIGEPGAHNAGLLAAQILATADDALGEPVLHLQVALRVVHQQVLLGHAGRARHDLRDGAPIDPARLAARLAASSAPRVRPRRSALRLRGRLP